MAKIMKICWDLVTGDFLNGGVLGDSNIPE